MTKILIIFSSTDGHTQKICSRLQKYIEQKGSKQKDIIQLRIDNNEKVDRHHPSVTIKPHVTLVSIDNTNAVNLESFDKIVIGASIRYGKHSKKVYAFISANEPTLSSKRSAFFSVNVVARKPEKCIVETNPYLQKFIKEISWQPDQLAIFAGKIDYKQYGFFDRNMIRFIMWMTKGPTDPKANIEFTNWSQVESFAQIISDMAPR